MADYGYIYGEGINDEFYPKIVIDFEGDEAKADDIFLKVLAASIDEYGNENFLEKEINIPFIKNGYEYELIHATECIINGIPESTVHTFEKSKYLCSTMDTIRKDWNMKYPWEEN